MSINAVTSLAQSEAIMHQIAARQAPATKPRPPGATSKESERSSDVLRAARQAGAGLGSSHAEKSEVLLRAWA